jgi:HAE1 family hydrophobic/amphiphilic exporter-1
VQARLVTEKEFGEVVARENADGSIVRLKDVARVELGAQLYNVADKLNGKPAAILAIYQSPDSNALDDQERVLGLMAKLKQSFPADLD